MNDLRKKVFVIGRNKTGTTSMLVALKSLGYRMGSQAVAELMLEDWAKRDFRKIVEYCKGADAFQDVPFSLDYTYVVLDQAFPGSKFILTVRRDSSEWYDSLLRFHTRMIGKNRTPTADDLKQFRYRKPEFLWQAAQLIYGADENTLYDRKIYTSHYESHVKNVHEYFRYRPDDLLVLNVSDPGAMKSLCDFLGIEPGDREMPHLNASAASSAE